MQLAIVLYPRFTALDAAGPHEVLGRLPETETVFVSVAGGLVANDFESMAVATKPLDGGARRPTSSSSPAVPARANRWRTGRCTSGCGRSTRRRPGPPRVCTGALILAGAGLLKGRRATTHWLAFEEFDGLGVIPVHDRVVIDGKYVTGAGVSAGIDMGLTLAGKIAGDEYAEEMQLGLEYAPEPPYDAGSPESAPASIVKGFTDNRPQALWGVERGAAE